jgi:hypothetical protein
VFKDSHRHARARARAIIRRIYEANDVFNVTEVSKFRKVVLNTFRNRLESKVKGKPIPLQALTDPEDSRRLRIPDLKTIGT